jgi:hypothetical protein
MSLPCDHTTFTNNNVTTSYPNFVLWDIDTIHRSLQANNYRYGFPGMNGRSWVRIGDIYNLVHHYIVYMNNYDGFRNWLTSNGVSDEDCAICYNALSMKFGFM